MENVITEDNDKTNLNNLNLYIFQGEIVGLIGVNEHGKEMLIQLICRNSPIKFGRIYIGNNLVNSFRHSDGLYNKVYVIEQKSKLVNDLSVADNVFVLRKGFRKYRINSHVLETQISYLSKELDLTINPDTICGNLTEYERCVVEIMKAMVQGVKLIVVNELSNFLSANDLHAFNELLRQLTYKKYAILYIGNHHEEIFPLCERVAFMKDGKIIKWFDKKEMHQSKVLPYTIPFADTHTKESENKHRVLMEFENITTVNMKGISFFLHQGECAVVYDKSNRVQKDIMELYLENKSFLSGICKYDGQRLNPENYAKYLGKEVAVIGENPIDTMLFYEMSYIDNLCFLLDNKTNKSRITKKIKKSIQLEYDKELGEELYANDIHELSKTSLYNLVYYRIHLLNPKLVLLIQPFGKADMYLRRHIIHLIRILKRKEIAVIILAVSISDCLYVADKLLLLEEGKVKETYYPDTFSQITDSN